MRYPILILSMVLAGLLAFTGTSHAAAMVHGDGGSWWDLLTPIYSAFSGGQYWYAGSMTVVVAVALAKRYGAERFPWVHSDEGGALLTFFASFAGAVSATLGGGGAMSWDVVQTAALIGVGAAGGYTVIKHLLVARLSPLVDRLPMWAQSAARSLLWVFDGKPVAKPADAGNTPASPSV